MMKRIIFLDLWTEEVVPEEIYHIYTENGVYVLIKIDGLYEFMGRFPRVSFSAPYFAMAYLYTEFKYGRV